MPRITLAPAQRQQLNDWLFGGPTDPVGIINWLAQNPDADPAVIYQAEGERDLYLLLLEKDGFNLKRENITQKMADAFNWVEDSIAAAEALGLSVEDNQQQMRPIWNFLRSL